MNAPFKLGSKVCCIVPIPPNLRRGAIYTVVDSHAFGRSVLIEVGEVPEVLFHPKRFVKLVIQ